MAHTTGELAKLLDAQLIGPENLTISRLEAVDRADAQSMTFIRSQKYAHAWSTSKAAAVIVSQGVKVEPGPSQAVLIVPDADLALIRMLEIMAPPLPELAQGIHQSATVDPSATIDPTAHIGPNCTIGPNATVGAGSKLLAGIYLGPEASVGTDSVLHPNVIVYHRCTIGDRCLIHGGVCIGADGFGYHPSPDGTGLLKVPHIGNVVIQDEVEIGANSCIDRAKFASTVIGAKTKIDNLVHIAHNCNIGPSCAICGRASLAGSVTLGEGVMIGGAVNVLEHVTIGAGAQIAGGSGVIKDVPAGEAWMGAPAQPLKRQLKLLAMLKDLPDKTHSLRKLEKLLNEQLEHADLDLS